MTVHGTKQIGALVVDDEEDIRFLIRMVIRNAGGDMAVVGEAADGNEALENIDAQDPDVVILDQRMPGLTGIETAREIIRRRPDQKIVLCSAYLDPELRREAEGVGIVVCIAKGEIKRIPQLLRELAGE
jgi:two-component system response regulator YesN